MTGRGGLIPLAAAVVAALAPAAQAQDWQRLEAGRGVSAVAIEWDSGAALAVQCRRDGLFAMLRLVQPVQPSANLPYPTVPITHDHPGGERRQTWMLNPDGGAAFSPTPERFARRLLAGGDIQLVVTPDEGPRQRYPLSLPTDSAPLASVLQACDVPLEHPLDNPPRTVSTEAPTEGEPPPAVAWTRRPSGTDLARFYPDEALGRGISGRATISCLVQATGRLADCEVISEYPRGAGFGQATVRVLERGLEMGASDGGPLPERAAGARVEIPLTWAVPR